MAVLNPSYLVVPPSLVGVSSGWVLARVIPCGTTKITPFLQITTNRTPCHVWVH